MPCQNGHSWGAKKWGALQFPQDLGLVSYLEWYDIIYSVSPYSSIASWHNSAIVWAHQITIYHSALWGFECWK